MIKFQSEADLEKFLMKSKDLFLSNLGPYQYKNQVRIGNYGIADIVGYFDSEDEMGAASRSYVVIELKNRELRYEDFFQACRYAKGLERSHSNNDKIMCSEIRIILFGTNETDADILYLPDLFENIGVYGYEISPKTGFSVREFSSINLLNEGF